MLQWLINAKIQHLADHLQQSNKQLDLGKFQMIHPYSIYNSFHFWTQKKLNAFKKKLMYFKHCKFSSLAVTLLLQVYAVNLPAEHLPRMRLTTDLASQVVSIEAASTHNTSQFWGWNLPSQTLTKVGPAWSCNTIIVPLLKVR